MQKSNQNRENYVRQSELHSRIGVLIEDKKFNRGSSITPNIGASNEMFNSKNIGRNVVLSNNNSQNEEEGSYDMKSYMNNLGLNNKS